MKKIICFILAAVLVLSLSACKSDKGGKNKSSDSSKTEPSGKISSSDTENSSQNSTDGKTDKENTDGKKSDTGSMESKGAFDEKTYSYDTPIVPFPETEKKPEDQGGTSSKEPQIKPSKSDTETDIV